MTCPANVVSPALQFNLSSEISQLLKIECHFISLQNPMHLSAWNSNGNWFTPSPYPLTDIHTTLCVQKGESIFFFFLAYQTSLKLHERQEWNDTFVPIHAVVFKTFFKSRVHSQQNVIIPNQKLINLKGNFQLFLWTQNFIYFIL